MLIRLLHDYLFVFEKRFAKLAEFIKLRKFIKLFKLMKQREKEKKKKSQIASQRF